MDIDQLHYFQSLADTKSFTASAKQMGLSQPAFSRSIQRLEDEFGQPLFERKTRSVELTEAGQLFQQAATQILRLVEDTKAQINDDGKTGRLRIGAIPTIAPFFLPGLLRRFSKEVPEAHLIVQENTTDVLLKQIKQGEVDVAILAEPINVKYVDVEELFCEELCLVLPPNHDLASKKQIRIADVEELPFVMLDEAHCLSDNITTFCRQKSVHPVVVERTSQLAMVQELVALDHGVSMIPTMAKKLDRGKRRTYRSFSGVTPTRTIVMVTNPYRFQSRLLGAFQETLREYSSEFRIE
ncbi:MAG: LysR family transcriptional regulator [Planctomycetota bacterium]